MLLFETVYSTFTFVLLFIVMLGIYTIRWIILYILWMIGRGLFFIFKPILNILVRGTNLVAGMLMGNE
jgi:hypothetical protein